VDLELKNKVVVVTGGAKGIGELPMDGPAPAILNAIENATGLFLKTMPLTPEIMMEAFLESAMAHEVGRGE
jgi:CO/xanthine dehydrogenase Mo-binding subunit